MMHLRGASGPAVSSRPTSPETYFVSHEKWVYALHRVVRSNVLGTNIRIPYSPFPTHNTVDRSTAVKQSK
jgi:hypothetical protein